MSNHSRNMPKYDTRNPPPPPRYRVNVPSRLRDAMPLIAGAIAEDVQRQADRSILGAMAFDVLAADDFDNKQWAFLLEEAAAFVLYMIVVERECDDARTIIELSLEWYTRYWIAALFDSNVDRLRRELPNDVIRDLGELFRDRERLVRTIGNFMNNIEDRERGRDRGYDRGYDRDYDRGGRGRYGRDRDDGDYGSRRDYARDRGRSRDDQYGGGYPRRGDQSRGGRDYSRGGFVERGGNAPRDNERTLSSASDTYTPTPRRTRAEPAQQMARVQEYGARDNQEVGQQQSQAEAPAVATPVEELVWTPSATQPYFKAYRRLLYTSKLALNEKGEVIQELTMNPQDHIIPGSPEAIELAKQEQAARRLEQANAEASIGDAVIEIDETGQRKPPQSVISDSTVIESSLEAAWTMAYVSRIRKVGDWEKIPMVYRQYADVVWSYVDSREHGKLIREITVQPTFISVARRLRQARNYLPEAICTKLERILTDTVNQYLAVGCGTGFDTEDDGYLSIEDFVADAEEAENYVSEKYNPILAGAYANNQAAAIKSAFAVLGDSEIESYEQSLIDPPLEIVHLTHLAKRYSLTIVDLDFEQLGIEFGSHGTAMVSSAAPELDNLVQDLFEQTANRDISHHLIRTRDGRTFEISNGYLVPGSRLIHEVKCDC